MNIKLYLTFFFSIILMKFNATAQHQYTEIDKKNILKINLLSPFLGTISIQHERIINNLSSFQLGFYYFSGLFLNRQLNSNGVCFTPEYRLYLTDDAPKGFYMQPYARVGRFWQDTLAKSHLLSAKSSTFTGVAVGIVFGKQWIIADRFSFDVYAGPLYTKVFFDNYYIDKKNLPPMFDGYWFRSGCTFGYYFK